MSHARLLGLVTVFLIASLTCGGAPRAADSLNVFLAGGEGDQDAVPRGSRIHKAVVDELSAVLQDRGFAVYGEATVAPGGATEGRDRHSDVALIEVARSAVRPPLDVAVIVSVHVRAETLSYTKKMDSQITARLLNVMTGRHLGNFRVASPRSLRAPIGCGRRCLVEAFERDTRRLSRELGRQVANRLGFLLDSRAGPYGSSSGEYGGMPTAYSIVFQGFSAEEVFEIEEYLVVFSGYRHHRPIISRDRQHEYAYETASARGRLNRNLSKMLDYLDLPGQVDLSGNVFTVTKSAAVESRANNWDDW
jgi:hypothetical protein